MESIVYHLPLFAGRYVEMPEAIIDRVVSPTAFIAMAPGHWASNRERMLVVLHAPPQAPLPRDAFVEMRGWAYTMAGAQRLSASAMSRSTWREF